MRFVAFATLLAFLGVEHHSMLTYLEGAFATYGYVIVFAAIMIESMGVPFPGETMLIIASAYAANNPNLSIYVVIGSAAGGAIVGDNLGYWIGREGGRRLIMKYGKFVGLNDDRYAKAQVFLKKHGGKAVFFGRFVSVARTWIAVLVGAHHLNWVQFLIYNVLGGIVWATLYGSLGYFFGHNLPFLEKILKDVGFGMTGGVIAAIVIYYFIRKRKKARAAVEAAKLSQEQLPLQTEPALGPNAEPTSQPLKD
jgi:membrane protein DedA with SNARE-associated domain